MALPDGSAPIPKLTFWRTVREAYGLVFGDFRRFFAIAEPRLLIMLLINFGWLVIERLAGPVPEGIGQAVGLLSVPFYISFAIAWHRAILLGEGDVRSVLDIGRRGMRYFLYSLLVALLSLPILAITTGDLALITAIAGTESSGPAAATAVFALAALVGVYWIGAAISARLALVFPAIAVDAPAAPLRRAWSYGRGNSFLLGYGQFVCFAPFAAIWVVGTLAGGAGASPMAEILMLLVSQIVTFVGAAVSLAFTTLAYRQLAPRGVT